MTECTWKNCNKKAVKELKDKTGVVWAHLCEKHFDMHEEVINKCIEEDMNPDLMRKVISMWTLAQGGAKKTTKRILREQRR